MNGAQLISNTLPNAQVHLWSAWAAPVEASNSTRCVDPSNPLEVIDRDDD